MQDLETQRDLNAALQSDVISTQRSFEQMETQAKEQRAQHESDFFALNAKTVDLRRELELIKERLSAERESRRTADQRIETLTAEIQAYAERVADMQLERYTI